MKSAVKIVLAAAGVCLLPLSVQAQEQEDAMPWDVPGDVAEAQQDAAGEAAMDAVAAAETALVQSANAEVLGVVQTFMDGLGDKDAEAMSAVALDTAFLAFVRPGEDGDAARTMPLARAISSLAETEPDISEPIRDPQVMVDGPVAMVWAPYDFYVEGTRNHCGVNVFSLLNRDGEWRIASVVYSYLPDDCPDFP